MFAKTLREAQERLQLSQREVERRTGIAQGYFYQLKMGRRPPPDDVARIVALARGLELDEADLLAIAIGTRLARVAEGYVRQVGGDVTNIAVDLRAKRQAVTLLSAEPGPDGTIVHWAERPAIHRETSAALARLYPPPA